MTHLPTHFLRCVLFSTDVEQGGCDGKNFDQIVQGVQISVLITIFFVVLLSLSPIFMCCGLSSGLCTTRATATCRT